MTVDPLIAVAAIGAVSGIVISFLNRRKLDKTEAKIEHTSQQVESLHFLINSNLTRQIEASIAEALARGIMVGVNQERRRKDKE